MSVEAPSRNSRRTPEARRRRNRQRALRRREVRKNLPGAKQRKLLARAFCLISSEADIAEGGESA